MRQGLLIEASCDTCNQKSILTTTFFFIRRFGSVTTRSWSSKQKTPLRNTCPRNNLDRRMQPPWLRLVLASSWTLFASSEGPLVAKPCTSTKTTHRPTKSGPWSEGARAKLMLSVRRVRENARNERRTLWCRRIPWTLSFAKYSFKNSKPRFHHGLLLMYLFFYYLWY
jgi:hypothetical protein